MLNVITNLGEGPKKLNAGNCVKEPSFILCVCLVLKYSAGHKKWSKD